MSKPAPAAGPTPARPRRLPASLLCLPVALSAAVPAFAQTSVVTFDEGLESWNTPTEIITADGGNPGAHLHIQDELFSLTLWTDSNPDFTGDLGGHPTVAIGLDVKTGQLGNPSQPDPRPFVVEFRNYALGADGYPFASVWYELGTLDSQQDWVTWTVSFDPDATELPDGWSGTGADDPGTGGIALPAGVTFADVLSGVDEVLFTTDLPGLIPGPANFDIRIDNLKIVKGGGGPEPIAPRYEIIDLGTFGGELANAFDINDRGQIVGVAEDPGFASLPFLWENGTMIHLGTVLPGATQAGGMALSISENGLVTGRTMTPYLDVGFVDHAFLWNATNGMIDLFPGSLAASSGWSVNAAGQVVGDIGGPDSGAFIWSAQDGLTMIRLPNSPFNGEIPFDINEHGVVVGNGYNEQFANVAWAYDSDSKQIRELPALGGASEANAINNAGDIVGTSSRPNNQRRPVLWTPDGEIVDLGFLPAPDFSQGGASDINEHRWIVGSDYYDGHDVDPKAWLWIDGQKFELRELIDDAAVKAEWEELVWANRINNHGEIVGNGIRDGIPGRAFLMRPIGGSIDRIFADGFQPSP